MEENRESLLPSLLPQVGMEFSTIDEAWMFWISYGGQKGFEVRKRYTNKRKLDGKISSCRYVCANEGHRLPDKRDHLTTKKKVSKVRNNKKVLSDGAAAPNISPSTSLPKEGMSEPYMVVNSFSELLTGSMTDGVIADF